MSDLRIHSIVKRRRRLRHQTTLVERLQARAADARANASKFGGPMRDALLQRAEQAEAAAELANDLLPSRSLGAIR